MPSEHNLIILVEPDEAVRSAISALIRQHGWRVDAYESAGNLALVLRSKHPATLICESELPDMEADDVLETGIQEGIPVIFLGHKREIQHAVDLIQMGARDFLEKPFPQERLLKTLSTLSV